MTRMTAKNFLILGNLFHLRFPLVDTGRDVFDLIIDKCIGLILGNRSLPVLRTHRNYSRQSLGNRRGDLSLATFSNDLGDIGSWQDAPLATGVYHAG
jgi:hypothetical protein